MLRTYAPAGQTPAGQTPVVRDYLTHVHLWAMSGITPEGKLFMTVQEQSYKGPDVVQLSPPPAAPHPGQVAGPVGPGPNPLQQSGQGINLSTWFDELHQAKERLRRRTHNIQACIIQPGLV